MNPLHAALSLALALPATGTESQLWGKTGDNWEPGGRWFEAIPPADLQPRNLHQAQWERRMGVMK